jgi:hypothetical protein
VESSDTSNASPTALNLAKGAVSSVKLLHITGSLSFHWMVLGARGLFSMGHIFAL